MLRTILNGVLAGFIVAWNGAATFIAPVISVIRSLPLLVRGRPGTTLRILCIIAFDTVAAWRTGRHLSFQRWQTLALLLDFGACANRCYDRKQFSPGEYQSTRRRLASMGQKQLVDDYVARLRRLELDRPKPGTSDWCFDDAQRYREDVVELSLGLLSTVVFDRGSLAAGVRSICEEEDLSLLFAIVMHCQLIDDALDYHRDVDARLPGFLTTSPALEEAVHHAQHAAREYCRPSIVAPCAQSRRLSPPQRCVLGSALACVAMLTRRCLSWRSWRGVGPGVPLLPPVDVPRSA